MFSVHNPRFARTAKRSSRSIEAALEGPPQGVEGGRRPQLEAQGHQIAHLTAAGVDLDREHLGEAIEDLAEARFERGEEAQVKRRDRKSLGARAIDGLFDRSFP